MMASTQVADPPDINEVKLRILAGDPKASDVYFQNSLNNSTSNKNGMKVVEFPKGVPGDVKVPGMITLLEDQNKNRLKNVVAGTNNTTGVSCVGDSISTTSPVSYSTITSPVNISCNGGISNGKSQINAGSKRSSPVDASDTSSNHVEIDVDMTLPQPDVQKDDVLVNLGATSRPKGDIVGSGQKTDNFSTYNSKNTVVIMNNLSNSSAAQSSSVTLGSRSQEECYEMYQQQPRPSSPKLQPSCEKDLEILKNVRKVFVQLTDDNTPCYYKVSDESQGCLFETVLGDTNGSIWSRYFKQQQKVILVHDRNQRGVLKLEFGRSRTISCCQTLRFAAMTASFKLKPEEPLCIIFKDKECCVSCCCCPEATYETVPQLDSIHPFSVFTKGRWKNRAELMVKHNDGSILGFIDKESNSYSLTMGENLGPSMKICLIGFLIAMDVMDRQDAGKLSCYLRPTTILLITLLLMLCITIGGYLLHHFSSMFLPPKEDSALCGTFNEAGSTRTAAVPHFNNDRISDSATSSGGQSGLSAIASTIMNASSPSSSFPTSEFQFGSSSLSGSSSDAAGTGAAATTITGGSNSTWPLF